uniref:Integrin beta n=1 Tax=Arion vulgaris TaxID=1028688 RepID=A0A0B6ZNF3_9EUPU
MTVVSLRSISLAFYVLLFAGVISQGIDEEDSDPCISASTCGQCIRASPLCAWCGSQNLPRGEARCDILRNLLNKKCPEKDISNPKFDVKFVKDVPWTSGGLEAQPVQVKPQELEFHVRPNEPVSFKLNFKQEENYPVDLYFLLDLSYGMVRQKEAQQRLIEMGREIPEDMKDITNNFKLGFGTFVDKVLMPYTAWTDDMLRYRCPLNRVCRPPHDFKHHVRLGDDAPNFANKMTEALEDVSQSMDDAEGGLDGLIQALDCDVIGWRNVSRRIIVYSSNSLFHLAGSGKLGGATRQSDLKCALNSDNIYEHEKIYDYPSVSQIASKLREKKANVIFAVMSNVTSHYNKLRSFLDGAVVGELAEDSKNIVDLIKTKYYELRSRIRFQAKNADNVTVVFKSKCRDNVVKETAECDNLEIKTSVEFDVTMTASSEICKGKTGIVERTVTLDAVGLNEQLVVKLAVRCDCDCEGKDHEVVNSDECSHGNGTFECGMCNCNPDRYGLKCECDESQISSEMSLEQCRMDKNETLTCSGKGECICGVCNCFPLNTNPAEKYSGDFCHCNDYSCPVGPNGLCGNPTRGVCKCGKCSCLPGWTGEDCECTTATDTCLTADKKMCNGFGTCKCGRCICTNDMAGLLCEDCLTCSPQCSEYIDCAQCSAHGTGKYNKEECESECMKVKVDVVDTLESRKGIRHCDGIDVDGCTFFFTYEYTPENEVLIKAQKTKDCPEEAPVAAIVGGTVAAVVLIPLLIICLIIFIRNRRDAKEYADFMKERDRAKWDSGANPIYKDPKSTFQNPTYRGGSD